MLQFKIFALKKDNKIWSKQQYYNSISRFFFFLFDLKNLPLSRTVLKVKPYKSSLIINTERLSIFYILECENPLFVHQSRAILKSLSHRHSTIQLRYTHSRFISFNCYLPKTAGIRRHRLPIIPSKSQKLILVQTGIASTLEKIIL